MILMRKDVTFVHCMLEKTIQFDVFLSVLTMMGKQLFFLKVGKTAYVKVNQG